MAPLTTPRRMLLLCAIAAVLGLAAGGAAWVLVRLIALATNAALFHRRSATLPSLVHLRRSPSIVVAAVVGGLAVGLLAKWSPVIRGHGIPEAMEAVLTRQSRIAPRTALAKPLSAAIAIGTGGPFGAEGPIIVTGGALGSLVGQVVPVSPNERKILLAAGAAAGMSATFGAPLASVVLAIELLLFEFSTRAFIPLVVASAVAAGVHSSLFGSGPLFAVPSHRFAGLARLPLYAVLGLACGLLAVVVTRVLSRVEDGFARLPVDPLWHPALGGLAFALVGLAVPAALGVGYDSIGAVLGGRLALGTLAALGTAKLVAWWLALGSGTSGGTLAPLLLVGGSFGAVLGGLADRLVPGLHLSPGAFAIAAMAATFGAATGAAFTAIVFLFELTRDYDAILPVMMATVMAAVVARSLMSETLMTEKLSRRGLVVPSDYQPDVLRTTSVDTVMTSDVGVLPAAATLAEAVRHFQDDGHGAYPVVDGDGRCVGVLCRDDLLGRVLPPGTTVGEVVDPDVVAVSPADTVLAALQRMIEEEVSHLPVVVDGGRLVGICTRADVLKARRRVLGADRSEPGWRPARRGQTRAT
jgi:H+/Cl- antiporter ClcA